MKRVENSVLYWGIYILVLGIALVTFPAATVAIFGYVSDGELWIRLTGVLSAVLGMYYVQIARNQISVLYRWKVIGHIFGLICMVAFWVNFRQKLCTKESAALNCMQPTNILIQ